ncbi:hypothetical protein ACHAQJ_009550 [Trichoderma viride]
MGNESIIDWINDLEIASDPVASLNFPEVASLKPVARNAARKRKAASPPLIYTEGDDDDKHTGVEYKSLDDSSVPAVAEKLFRTMTEIEQGLDIIPGALKQIICDDQELTPESFKHSQWRRAFKSDGPDDLPGRIPSIAQIKKILAKAIKCKNYKHEEASWRAMVHIPLLELILEDDLGEQCDDFNAMICTTARPHRKFRPISSSAKMIDICVYYTALDPDMATAIKAFCGTTPTLSTNHTDHYALQFCPIILSVEIKQPGAVWERAQLQTGVWLAAHWAFLHWGVKQKLLNQRMAQDAPADDLNAETLKALSKLGFIPGIVINGHQWHLVISTYNGRKATLWAESLFGETKSLVKIYAIIAGVRELAAWGRDVYLPWFKENILTLGS